MWGGPFRSPRMFFPGAPAWFGLGICVKCSPVAFQPFWEAVVCGKGRFLPLNC